MYSSNFMMILRRIFYSKLLICMAESIDCESFDCKIYHIELIGKQYIKDCLKNIFRKFMKNIYSFSGFCIVYIF